MPLQGPRQRHTHLLRLGSKLGLQPLHVRSNSLQLVLVLLALVLDGGVLLLPRRQRSLRRLDVGIVGVLRLFYIGPRRLQLLLLLCQLLLQHRLRLARCRGHGALRVVQLALQRRVPLVGVGDLRLQARNLRLQVGHRAL